MRHITRACAIAAFAAGLVAPAAAYATGTVQGTVVDSSANPVGSAPVTVCLGVAPSLAQAPLTAATVTPGGVSCQQTTTNATGQWSLAAQTAGSYAATVYPPASGVDAGAQETTVSGTLQNGATLQLNATLVVPTPLPSGTSITNSSGGVSTSGVPTIYWGATQTLVTQGCPGGTVTWSLSAVNTETGQPTTVSGSFTEGPSGTFTATIPALMPLHGPATITMSYDCSGTTSQSSFTVYIDPSGEVVDQNGAPIAGATVTLLSASSQAGPFTPVPNGSAVMSPANRINPSATNGQGLFGWDVAAGYYEVSASEPGCSAPGNPSQTTVTSSVLTIPPPATGLTLTMNCAGSTGGSNELSLSLAAGTTSLGSFTPGVTQTYAASTGATVTSTAQTAMLTVADTSSVATGHLVNGTFVLAQPLQIDATDLNQTAATFAPVGSAADPTLLLSYNAPVADDQVTIGLQQLVNATDPLLTGTYSKSLTFTLSTTSP